MTSSLSQPVSMARSNLSYLEDISRWYWALVSSLWGLDTPESLAISLDHGLLTLLCHLRYSRQL